MWSCPKCKRRFTRKNQRHACGTGSRLEVLRGRPDSLVALYSSLESFAKTRGPVEVVARDRYVLFRSRRIFADLVVMTDALRVAVHLGRWVADPIFFKIAADRKRVSHVAKLQDETSLSTLKPYLREAYEFSIAAPSTRASSRMLNRAVLIVRPKQPFLDWAVQLDDSGLVPNVEGEQTVYLVPEFDDDDGAQKVLKRVFGEVFERELFGWHTDESAWPRKRTLAMFREW